MTLTWPQSRKRIQFATLGANDAAIKHYCKMKVNPKSNLVYSNFFFISSFHFLLHLFSFRALFVNSRSFYFFYLVYDHEKHKSYKNLVSMFIDGGLIF
jgi:hypothetical protein